MKLLYYCPFAIGGIVDYSYNQAAALADAGADVTLLTASEPAFRHGGFAIAGSLEDEARPIRVSNRRLRQVLRTGVVLGNIRRLKDYIERERVRHVLLSSFSEYAAPLWSHYLRRLAGSGVQFAAMLHDPVRNYVAGPGWWHKWSIRSGYSFLSEVFVHEPVDRGQSCIPEHVRLSVIPHGPAQFPPPAETREEIRRRLSIPMDARLLLSFGQIRDGKNLDLAIRALRSFVDFWLLVAGQEAGGVQRPRSYYQELASQHGVGDRCRWIADYVPADEVGSLFSACDMVLLAYARSFRSASGVLNAAVQFRKPCLVSSGEGSLQTQVQRYRLGIQVEPDSEDAIRQGFRQWLGGVPDPLWSEYLERNSWRQNAELVLERMFCRQ